ncbi:YDL144C [Saccharomyces arboricola H-6]|uniref:YDL144C n=1 Tax=Saccharomyces arboricola (strain H-6 / AS 2.3317 / CBS 10644) TaxID=1160507 RepID=J8PQH6_SACAR|nr:YDL144C [Saccharomyces arboricola H-6]
MPRVLVIGAGGVGVITALSLWFKRESDVSLVVRSDYDKVSRHGYTIESCDYGQLEGWRPHNIYRTVEDAAAEANERGYDYVVVTTKNIIDGPADSRLPNIIRPVLEKNKKLHGSQLTTHILLVQNGIDIEKDILQEFPKDEYQYTVLSGIQLIGSTKIGTAHISQVSQDYLTCGAFDPQDTAAVQAANEFVKMYSNEGHNFVEFDPRVRYSRWKKLVYNAAINTSTALVGLDVPRCLEFGVDKKSTEVEVFRPAMEEIIAIAASEGITIEEKFITTFTEITRNKVFKPSMCVDRDKGQLMELEVILGNPIRIARKNGVPTPTLSVLYYLLVLVQARLKEQKGLLKFDEQTARLVNE